MTKIINPGILKLLPFMLLILIGFIPGDITYQQKTFKTLLILTADIILLAVFIFNFARNKLKTGAEKNRSIIVYFLFYFLFILIQFSVSYFSGETGYDREYHLVNYISLIMFGMFVFFSLDTISDAEKGLLALDIAYIASFIWIICNFAQNNFIFSNLRPVLSFGNTDYFAGFIIGILPVSISGTLLWILKSREPYNAERKKHYRVINVINAVSITLGIISLIFSQTKSAFFGFFIGSAILMSIGITFILVKKRKYRYILTFGLLLILAGTAALILVIKPPVLSAVFDRFLYAYDNFGFILKDRTENAWAGGLGLFYKHPILGGGLGTVYAASFQFIRKYFYIYSDSNSFKHSHNEFIEVLGEGGIVGIIFFSLLILFIIIPLFRRIFSGKYIQHYRLLCLGAASGIVSMLIHQIFSLSLRMSVTMSAYFFLLGFSLFLISRSDVSLIDAKEPSANKRGGSRFCFFRGDLSRTGYACMFSVMGFLLTLSLFLFIPYFRSETSLSAAKKTANTIQKKAAMAANDAYLKKDRQAYDSAVAEYTAAVDSVNRDLNGAISIRNENAYAWTEKFFYDLNINLPGARTPDSRRSILIEIRKDLDTLNSIIPNYQDIWLKYALYYIKMNEFYYDTGNLPEARKSLIEALAAGNKSLDINFLNIEFHIHRLNMLKMLNDREGHIRALNECIKARIFLDYSRQKKIPKERITVDENAVKSGLRIENGRYLFSICPDDITFISNKFFTLPEETMDNSLPQHHISEINNFMKVYFSDIEK